MEFEEDIKDFLIECIENLATLDRDILLLEKEPGDKGAISSAFRAIHTIKGTSGFFGFDRLGMLTHTAEAVLSAVREGELTLTPKLISIILEAVDGTKRIVEQIQSTGSEGADVYAGLRARLEACLIPEPAAPVRNAPDSAEAISAALHLVSGAEATQVVSSPEKPESPSALDQHAQTAEHTAEPVGPAGDTAIVESTIRVDVGLLNRLMNLVGELVLARNQLLQDSSIQSTSMQQASQRLNLITSELQESVMKTRMQPINVVWGKLPRVVRDLAAQCGKKIELEMQGAGTELDKTIIEAIKDPLTHLVRNCCDHGIETPEVRAAKGKRPEGTIQLRAYHEGGVVNIEISDDGQGIDAERIRMKAVERGLLTPDQAARLSTREAIHLIFMPGFSTAAQVTSISGRGVGMDVVKNNIEKIGGSVEVLNRAPAGTTINIKIPLTLAIIPGLLITLWKPSGAPRLDDAGLAASTGSAPESPGRQVERRADPRAEPLVHFSGERRQRPEDRFIIPQVNLLELLHIEATEVATRVEQIHGTSILHHRGKLLPLINLSALLNRPEARRRRDDGISVVIVQAEQRQFGLVVDRICDTQEIVVKPLGRQLKSLTCYVGATIMGDGRPALILDVAGLARLAGLSAPPRRMAEDETKAVQGARSSQKLLLFCSGGFPRVAVPLSLVDRLEETDSRKIERAGGRLVLHYCNAILPLVTLEEVARGIAPELDPASKLQMIVFSDGTHRLGLIVDRILDIVDTEITARRGTCVPGLLGSALVDGAVTDLLDLQTVLAAAGESWSSGASSEALRPKQILLAESDRVARELLYRDLEVSDYEVVTAESAQETLQLLRQRPFDLVLTSLDLGRRDGGIDLLAQLKADAKLERLGVIGIHPQHSRGGQLRRMSLGEFDACIARGNRSEMLSTIEAVLSGRPVAVEAVA